MSMVPTGKTWAEWYDALCADGDEEAADCFLDEVDDCMDVIDDDVVRALDFSGWMIVPKPGGPADDGRKWPMDGRGKPRCGRPPTSEAQCAEVLKLRKQGRSLRGIVKDTSLSRDTVRTIVRKSNTRFNVGYVPEWCF